MNRRQRRLAEATATLAPALKAGDFVSWAASKGSAKGKVVSVHANSKVPGVSTHLVGSKTTPAARVQLFAKSPKGGYEPTSTYLAHPADTLTVIEPLTVAATEAVACSFDDIRSMVQDAISDRAEALTGVDVDVYVVDIGSSWAVYTVNFGDDLYMIDYTIAGNVVTLGDQVGVDRVTSYVIDEPPVDAPTGDVLTESVDRIEGRLLGAMGTGTDGARVFAVRIIAYGDSKNNRRYPESVLRAAAPMYEGAKAYDHHRTEAELQTSTIVGVVGHYEKVTAQADGIHAELHLLPSAAHTAECLDQALANQAAGMPPLVGISHDVMAQYKPIISGGRKMTEATGIVSVFSADVVADPAAGGLATRMVAAMGDITPQPKKETTMTLKQLVGLLRGSEAATRPDLLTEHAHVIESAGLTADEVLRIVEADTAPAAAAPVRSVDASFAKSSAMAGMLIESAVRKAALGDHMVEAITGELADSFTEADLASKIASAKRIVEGAERADLKPTVHALEGVTEEAHDKKLKALDAMLDPRNTNGYRSLKEAYIDITGANPRSSFGEDFNREILRESATLRVGGERTMFDSALRGTESVSSSTWGFVLGDSITRRLVAEYNQPNLRTWEPLVSNQVPVNDFRTQRIERLGGYGVLPAVNQGAPYQSLTSPTNEEVTYAVTKRGGTDDLTLETIANDDLRAVQRIPQKLGLAAAQTLFRFVWDFVQTNPSVYDSVTLFHVNHANTTSTPLSSTALEASRVKMRKQTAYGDTSDILSLVPKYLFVPPDLEPLAYELCTSAVAIPSGAPVGAASSIPNLHQGMVPIVVDYWSALSATQWYIMADSNLCPTIELGFYQGQDQPALFVQNDPTVGSVFTADKMTWKIRHIYSGAVLDYRGFQRGNS